MNEPEIIIKNQPIDIELCELLGDKPADFLVLCFDGGQFEAYGTPYDTAQNRIEEQGLVDALNDRSKESLWPMMWHNWRRKICKQFFLPETTKANDYRPEVSYKISRVCPGYSEHLHAAIGLFDRLADKIGNWNISSFGSGNCFVEIRTKNGAKFECSGGRMALAIAETVSQLLKDSAKP